MTPEQRVAMNLALEALKKRINGMCPSASEQKAIVACEEALGQTTERTQNVERNVVGLNEQPSGQPPSKIWMDVTCTKCGATESGVLNFKAPQQASQEPVATLHNDGHWTPMKTEAGRAFDEQITRLSSRIEVYTAAPPRECKECAAKQAEIDRLMLEYCPDEMTPEQVAEWAASQRPVSQEPIGYLDESDLRGLVQGNAVWLHPENQGRMVRVYTAPQPGGRESVVLHKVVADHIKDLRACVPALEVYPEMKSTTLEVIKAADELEAALNPSLAKSAAQESVALKEARRIAAEYAEPDSQVDSGNLYWALCEALKYATPEGRPDR